MGKEIKVLMQNENVQTGTITFNNVKEIEIFFTKPFKKPPKISLTFRTAPSTTNPYIVQVNTQKFIVSFQNSVSCDIDYLAIEA